MLLLYSIYISYNFYYFPCLFNVWKEVDCSFSNFNSLILSFRGSQNRICLTFWVEFYTKRGVLRRVTMIKKKYDCSRHLTKKNIIIQLKPWPSIPDAIKYYLCRVENQRFIIDGNTDLPHASLHPEINNEPPPPIDRPIIKFTHTHMQIKQILFSSFPPRNYLQFICSFFGTQMMMFLVNTLKNTKPHTHTHTHTSQNK